MITLFSVAFFTTISVLILSNLIPVLNDVNLSFFEKLLSVVLISSFIYSGLHCVGYVDHFIKSLTLYRDHSPLKKSYMDFKEPSMAIIIPTLNEDPDMVRKTLLKAKSVDYGNFEVVLMDSSTDSEIRRETCLMSRELGVRYLYRDTLRGYKAGSINDTLKILGNEFKYVMVLDSDHRLKPSILRDLIPYFEEDPSLTFIQTPQYFNGLDGDRLGLAYSFQQHIFYKHICRGLCVNDSSYICGTNVLIRTKHLEEIGGMDETCITEDISTSFIFHTNGYKSLYIDQIYAEGLSPPSLSAYYGQQLRWSYGTFQNTRRVISKFLREPGNMKLLRWWEYLILNGTLYFIGVAIFIWLLYPVSIIMLNLEPMVLGPLNLPFYIFIFMILIQTISGHFERGYSIKKLILAQALFFSLFPVYTRAFFMGILNRKLKFKVTPKKEVYKISFKDISPLIVMVVLLTISVVIGVHRINLGEDTLVYPSIVFWASYSLLMLLIFIFYYYLEDRRKYNRQLVKS
ncbi:MAG TPA: glycosyltransferase, partial [Methanobacterium sp.]